MLRAAGFSARDVIATRSRAYRTLGLGDRSASDEELLALMAEAPTLIRRPIVVVGDRVVVGADRERLSQALDVLSDR